MVVVHGFDDSSLARGSVRFLAVPSALPPAWLSTRSRELGTTVQ